MSDLSSQRLELTPEERQAKLDRQKQLVEQKRKQRQMQAGMLMSTGLYRPQGNKYHRLSSRPGSGSSQSSQSSGQSTRPSTSTSTSTIPDSPLTSSSSAARAVQTEAVNSSLSDGDIPRDLRVVIQVTQTDQGPPKSKSDADAVAMKLASLGLSPASHYDESDSSTDEVESEPLTGESTISMSSDREMAIAPTSDSTRTKSASKGAHGTDKGGSSLASVAAPSAVDGIHEEDAASAALLDIHLDDQGITNLQDLVFQIPPKSAVVKCRITRDKHGLDKHMYPIYQLHLEWEAGARLFLLVGRKRKRSRCSNYVISVNASDLTRGGSNYIAKLRSNFVGTSFTLYDRGTNPSRRSSTSANVREELCMVHYDTNVLGFKGPRKMDVIVPSVSGDGKRRAVKPTREQETLLERFKYTDMRHLLHLSNKQPIWSEETQAYVLNFHGRVTQASVKNFQLVHETDPDYIVMQFGRISEDCFTMDFRYPLCAVQAFAIALSSFDSKLACE